jgi:O-antigen ligase
LVGGGFQVVDVYEIGVAYNPDFQPGQAGAHSVYFEVLGENGFITFGIFLALLISTILSGRSIRIQANRHGVRDFDCYGRMLQIGILGYAISGAFLEFGTFDLYYQLIAITVVTKVILRREIASRTDSATRVGSQDVAQPASAST